MSGCAGVASVQVFAKNEKAVNEMESLYLVWVSSLFDEFRVSVFSP